MVGVTHNLRYFKHQELHAEAEKWAILFDHYVKEAIEKRDFEALVHFEKAGKSALMSHPSIEHFLPLLYIAGMVTPEDQSHFIHEGFQNQAFSMRAWQVG